VKWLILSFLGFIDADEVRLSNIFKIPEILSAGSRL
jgi:hypothetical protein